MRKIILLSLLAIFFLYFFFVYDTNFHGPDEPIYYAYTASVVEDGDLNAVNHLDKRYPSFYLPSGKIRISETYNLPDFHNHGGVILWAPFYAYAKFIYFIATKFNLTGLTVYEFDKFTKCAMSFSTIIFGFFTILFTYMLCNIFNSSKISVWSTLVIFLGTPFFYYTLHEVGNAQIVASLFSILSIWFCSYAIGMRKTHWFLYGLFFSICMVIKVDLWFQIFFISFLFIVLLIMRQTTWLNGVYFFLGLLPMLILKIVNDYIKYGTFHIGELGTLNLRDFYLFKQLFSSYRGFFYTSPIFYICLLGFIFVTANFLTKIKSYKFEIKMKDLFLFILTSYLVIKVIFLSYRYAWGGGTCGARPLLTEFPIFVLLYARTMDRQKKYLLYSIVITSVFFVFWNLLVISEYISGIDLSYVKAAPELRIRINALNNILSSLFYIKDLDFKLRFCMPLLLTVLGVIFYITGRFTKPINSSFWYIKNQSNHKPLNFFLLAIYLCTAYIIITSLNIFNNGKKVEKLKADGFFENVQVIQPRDFEKRENSGSMDEMIEYFTLKGDIDRVNRIKKHKREIYGEDR